MALSSCLSDCIAIRQMPRCAFSIGVICVFDSEGKYIDTDGEYPSFGAELSPLETVEAYVCEMACDPVNEYIWLFYKLTDLIEIYTYDGKLVKRMHGPDRFFPAVSERSFGEGLQSVASVPGETRDVLICSIRCCLSVRTVLLIPAISFLFRFIHLPSIKRREFFMG